MSLCLSIACIWLHSSEKWYLSLNFISFTAGSPDFPLQTYNLQNQNVEQGHEARFFCEAFVGPTHLPDSQNSISWFQLFDDNNEQKLISQELRRQAYAKVWMNFKGFAVFNQFNLTFFQFFFHRDKNQTVGALLIIPNVKPENYGRYLCRVGDGAAHSLELGAWLYGEPVHAQNSTVLPAIILALGAVALVILLMLVIKYTSLYVTVYHRRDKKLCHTMNSSDSIRIREVI